MINSLVLKLAKSSKSNDGFTLIELLVVIIIVGILSAVALPSMLNQTSKAKEVEAKTTISSVNNAQNAFRTEKAAFAPDMESLALGLPKETNNYIYNVIGKEDTAAVIAKSKDTALKGYVGGVVRYGLEGQSAIATIVCVSKTAGTESPIEPALDPTQTTPETAARCDSSQEKL